MIRAIWVVAVLFAGTGVLLYLLLWIILPQAPLAAPPRTGYAPVYPSTQPFYTTVSRTEPVAPNAEPVQH